jgi:hypothetical protein
MKKLHLLGCLLTLALLAGTATARGKVLSIRNASLEVRFDTASQQLTILAQGRAVLADGQLGEGGGPAQVVVVNDKTFGAGQTIVREDAQVALYPDLPFALLQLTLRNTGAEAKDIRSKPGSFNSLITTTKDKALFIMRMTTGPALRRRSSSSTASGI